ncbi:MAG: GspE/PulE family protein [Planctomycetes bacterium]|nr:GspE/PulE family protein [Planctomycetota bacterium]
MPNTEIQQTLAALKPAAADYAAEFVERLLAAARAAGASDVHLQPAQDALEVRWRVDGVLQSLGRFSAGESSSMVARLKVLAELLTYRTDIPQEGRIRSGGDEVEMRVSTFPTLHGERAVVRLFAAPQTLLYLESLGLPEEIRDGLARLMAETSGAVIIAGPAGSGKTTTAYACLREVLRTSERGRSVVSLEDPIEAALPGVAQSQVNRSIDFTLATGLRSLMRQDPEVILVGEIRDRPTAEAVFQAALTGHLVVTTFHAGSAAGAISRLSDMGIEPYLLRSGILAIVCQRLVRRLCSCSRPSTDDADRLGLPVSTFRAAVGCEQCRGLGYRGRLVLAEMLTAQPTELGRAILSRDDSARLEALAVQAGMRTRWRRACEAVEQGLTSPAEIRRVFGFLDVQTGENE